MSKDLALKIREQEFDELFGDLADDAPLTYEQGCYIEKLLANSAIPPQKDREIHQNLYKQLYTNYEAIDLIDYLEANQLDRINSGFNYSQTDIKYKLRNDRDA